ncbi:hypothetical protein HNR46_000721 [Haloferula luteola]|uniref:Uncharacterized protein n=1 Tax=Haloferula luteola TaxID=595692 RepID=A0A840UZR9_9BACT|nr:DUF6428 family protein [Haloferula luteola]MBB5350493.1 hypothetical protein [Haloferula luteola]
MRATYRSLLTTLRSHPQHAVEVVLPNGESIPAHFHITEVGHVSKSFLDCGGQRHTLEWSSLQAWVADDIDHRLSAEKLARILERAQTLLPSSDLPIEIEWEVPHWTQLPVLKVEVTGHSLRLHTEFKHTDCLAKDICLPDFTLPPLPGQKALCTPGSGCC